MGTARPPHPLGDQGRSFGKDTAERHRAPTVSADPWELIQLTDVANAATEDLSEPDAGDADSEGAGTGWALLWASIKEERRFIMFGQIVALGWSLGRVAMPLLA